MRNMVVAGALALAACGQPAEQPKAAEVPAKLPAGQYEVTAKVTSLVSTDKTPLPTFAKVGDTIVTQGCVGADGTPPAAMLATKGDQCAVADPYIRNGRMNLTLDCTRKGQGKVMSTLNGSYTADGFTGTLTATSTFSGSGDYRLVEEISGRKVADQCSPEAADNTKA